MRALPALPKICVCIGHADASEAASAALLSCDHGELLLELRIDMLAEPALGQRIIRRIRRRHPDAVVLATCRRRQNGGRFRGTVQEQQALLRAAAEAGARLVDLEIETVEEDPRAVASFQDLAATLVSYHNFEKTPALGPVLRRLEKAGADYYKIATTVRKPSDNLKLLALCRERGNLVVAGMGETGAASRLLSPSYGGLFTFAAPDPRRRAMARRTAKPTAQPTAPGQLLASDVRQLYRVQVRQAATKAFGVIAKPVAHSMSPLIHNRAFKSTRFDGIYLPFLVEPTHLADFFRLLRELPLAGVSVTLPHKRRVVRLLDGVDEAAAGLGAVNTIYWKRGKLIGANTDVDGIARPLAKRAKLNRSRALVVGNGGAAVAAVFALQRAGAEVWITGRNAPRVKRFARSYGARSIEFARLGGDYFDILIQATPVGMHPRVRGNLFPKRIPADIVFDLVYNPVRTALLEHAEAEGKTVISGVEMFVEQAAAQFRIWTGREPPLEVMRAAVLERTVK